MRSPPANGPPIQRTATQTREHVLRIAHDLFYWRGIRATGIDKVASEAGVAPTTLYRLFASKDDLVAAYVERADRLHREWFTAAVEAAGPDPRARILAVFDALAQEIEPGRCRGCPFQMSLAELADRDLPAYRHAVATKRWIRDRFGELAAELARVAPVRDPDALADQLTLVMEGVYASALSLGTEGPASQGRAVVEVLIGPR